MSSNKLNQKEYLKKYLGGDVGQTKKKKKNKDKTAKKPTVTIVDDDIDLSQLANATEEDLDNYNLGEDLPQIAGIIDEKPAELIAKEDYKTSAKWKSLDDDNARERLKQASEFKAPQNTSRQSNRSPDNSPPRRSKRSQDASPPRRKRSFDASPPRRSKRSPDASPPRRKRSPDASPPRRKRSPDASPPRRSKRSPDASPPRRSKRSPDASPPRRTKRSYDASPPRRSKRSPDASPPRSPDASPPRRSKRSPDASPPRRKRSPDASPPRRLNRSPDASPRRRFDQHSTSKNYNKRSAKDKSESPPPTHKKMMKTLDSKIAGLQNATALREENEQFRKRENDMFRKIAEKEREDGGEQSVRSRKTGRGGRFKVDPQKEQEKLKKEEERKKVYDRWGRGLKQIEEYQRRTATESHEMNKPIARYADDADLESYLQGQCRDGDPMAEYFRKKANESKSGPSKPVYPGSFPENRFNIRPGYRWDGVDRSNGYEKKWFDIQNQKKATEEEAYKYSVEDM